MSVSLVADQHSAAETAQRERAKAETWPSSLPENPGKYVKQEIRARFLRIDIILERLALALARQRLAAFMAASSTKVAGIALLRGLEGRPEPIPLAMMNACVHHSVLNSRTTAAKVEMLKVNGRSDWIVIRLSATSPTRVPSQIAGTSAKVRPTSEALIRP